MNMNQQPPNTQTRNNLVFSSNPSTPPSNNQILQNLIPPTTNQMLAGAIPFADLISQQRNQHNHLAAMQQQAFSASLAGNPHLAQQFQLVQRPLLISSRQSNLIHNLNDQNPNNLAALSNLLNNSNQTPIQLLMRPQNQQQQQQQQQQNINLQMRNILAAAASQPHHLQALNLNQQNNSMPQNSQQFFLSNQPGKVPQMIFLSENQFQEMNQQHLINQQKSVGNSANKSPTVTSTTSFSDVLSQSQSHEQQTTQVTSPQPLIQQPQQLASLMNMSFDNKFIVNLNDKQEEVTLVNESNGNTSFDVDSKLNPEIIDEKSDDNNKNSSGYERFASDRFNSLWRNNQRRSFPNASANSRPFPSYNSPNNMNKNNDDYKSSYQNKPRFQNNYQLQSKRNYERNDEEFKRNLPYNKQIAGGSTDYDTTHHSNKEFDSDKSIIKND